MPWDGRKRIFGGLVFEHDVPRVAGLAEDGDHPSQVGLLIGAGPFAVDLGLDLDADGIRGKLGDLSIGEGCPASAPSPAATVATPRFRISRRVDGDMVQVLPIPRP